MLLMCSNSVEENMLDTLSHCTLHAIPNECDALSLKVYLYLSVCVSNTLMAMMTTMMAMMMMTLRMRYLKIGSRTLLSTWRAQAAKPMQTKAVRPLFWS